MYIIFKMEECDKLDMMSVGCCDMMSKMFEVFIRQQMMMVY